MFLALLLLIDDALQQDRVSEGPVLLSAIVRGSFSLVDTYLVGRASWRDIKFHLEGIDVASICDHLRVVVQVR